MANRITTDEIKEFLEARAKEFGNNIPNPAKAIQEQAASLRNFQEQVTKQFGETRSLLDGAKAFLKDPKGEGLKIVKDGVTATDKFFGNLFKLLSKDVGQVFKDAVSKSNQFILGKLDSFVRGIVTKISKVTFDVGTKLSKVEGKFAQSLTRLLGSINTNVNRSLANWGKTTGLSGLGSKFTAMSSSLKTIGTSISKNSQTLSGLSALSKSFGTLLQFARLGLKMLPILGAVFDLKWKNDTRQFLVDIKRQQDLNAKLADRQFSILGNKLRALESKNTVDYSRIGSAVKSNIPSDLARKSDVNYRQQFQTIASSLSALKNLGQTTTIDYSRIQNSVTIAINAAKTTTQTPAAIDYTKVTAAAAAALTAANLSPSTIADLVVIRSSKALTPAQTQKPIDYAQVTASVTKALTAAQLSPGTISDSVVAKTKSVTPIELAQILARNNTTQSLAQAAAIKQGLAGVKVEIPTDLARKSDVEAIPGKIPKPTLDFSPVLTRLTSIDNTLINLGQRLKPVDLNPIQSQLNQLQNGLYQIPGQVTTNIKSFGDSIVNNLSNFITQNNTTIVNQFTPALNPDAIINPIKTHINTQVAQPLATTMEVLNVNDLKRGITMSGEAVIKASGFQQYGQSGTGTATNLIGLTAMMAAPLFMRAGFHQLGTEFPKDIRKPLGDKVTPTTALSTSQWQFNQVTNLVGMNTPHIVKDASGATTIKTFQNQAHIVEEIHAQNLGLEQDVSAIEKYCFYLLQNQEMMIQMILQNKHDIDVLIDESGAKTEQKIILRPGLVTHSRNESFFDKVMSAAESAMVVRKWKGDIDAKQLALKTNMEAQIAAMTNKFEFDKTNPVLPIVDRQKQNPKTAQDEEWKRYVNTSENPGTVRQSSGMPVPEIKEIKFGSDREIAKPTTDPDKLLGS